MILVTGGAGYIGSQTVKHLTKNRYDVVVYDNLSTGHKAFVKDAVFVEGDIGDRPTLDQVFGKYEIDAVIHFAANAYVGESVFNPAKYYRNNVCNTFTLLDAMREHDVKRIIFSSSCATYGIPDTVPITEETVQNPVNPYGMTKYVVERMLADFKKAYGFNFVSLRYFNAAGADMDGELGELHDPETHVIPLMLESVYSQKAKFTLFGSDYDTSDGTCVRDYIHVDDLADAHVKAVKYLDANRHHDYLNLGTGKGVSVLELVNTVESVTGIKVKIEYCGRRSGDPAELVASNSLAKAELSWSPTYSSIENIVSTAWQWFKRNHSM